MFFTASIILFRIGTDLVLMDLSEAGLDSGLGSSMLCWSRDVVLLDGGAGDAVRDAFLG